MFVTVRRASRAQRGAARDLPSFRRCRCKTNHNIMFIDRCRRNTFISESSRRSSFARPQTCGSSSDIAFASFKWLYRACVEFFLIESRALVSHAGSFPPSSEPDQIMDRQRAVVRLHRERFQCRIYHCYVRSR
ncbi:hypothetical protein EVAR_81776_1 [Eumeta japonica]|uniref:Uncharacterized protein n=1 Tax=Eumeta variegata TaxID=151549 RepID=A0A4C1UIU4_EUMVA|nr:hypothetical protein EVAR_81776_1 [Eumeta japonica]